MTPDECKTIFDAAVAKVCDEVDMYVKRPGRDFVRNRKISVESLLRFLVTLGGQATQDELLDFFSETDAPPSEPALVKQREKLHPDALRALLRKVDTMTAAEKRKGRYSFFAVDGSKMHFASDHRYADDSYRVPPSHSGNKPYYTEHLNALYDLENRVYVDGVIQSYRGANEYTALCQLCDGYQPAEGELPVFIVDRGYTSLNTIAHMIEKGWGCLFRSKDVGVSGGILQRIRLPNTDTFDVDVTVEIYRSRSKKIELSEENTSFISKKTAFDFLEYGSTNTYKMDFRVVRLQLDNGQYEVLITTLPRDSFPPQVLKALYALRWIEEDSFRSLKYTLGTLSFHSAQPDLVTQEIWAHMIEYNLTELMVQGTATAKPTTDTSSQADTLQRKYAYRTNFSRAAHACRLLLRDKMSNMTAITVLSRHLVPIRLKRNFPRHSGRPYRPRYFLYRAA